MSDRSLRSATRNPHVVRIPARRWAALGSLPVAAAALVALNALYMVLVAFGNVTDFGTNQEFVHHVLSMDTTNFGRPIGNGLDPEVTWRAVTSAQLQDAAYVALIAWETLTGIVLCAALVLWIRERGRGRGFATARALSSIGLLMIVLLFMGGFIGIGGEWFQMWRSTTWNGEDAALRNAVLALVSLVFVHLPSRSWHPRAASKIDLTSRES